MSEVKEVTAIVSNPVSSGDTGRATIGFYVVEDGLLTMTDGEGRPVRPGRTGQLICHRLKAGEDERTIARRLTLRIYDIVQGQDRGSFNRKIEYDEHWMA
ncbi:hypothetical protein WHZ78_17565 [Bradyrhizobium symbiodeficiens]|uniref:hypothetical protein n=1 Tax=Bradyrhizobium symbiodeficiens TaxID=1404367 RepID=UPI0030CC4512